MRRAAILALALLLAAPEGSALAGGLPPETALAADAGATEPAVERLDATDRWIVVMRNGATMEAAGADAGRLGITRDRTFRGAVRGYSAHLTAGQVAQLRADPEVASVVPDAIISLAAQTVPRGVRRIYGPLNPVARINGSDERVDADVAIVDTGIDGSHPDLNVVGGYNCSSPNSAAWGDANGHGTHVAGTVGALDNGSGVVGVAPGVRLWAVRILNAGGNGLVSWYLCGLDWITAQRDPGDPNLPLFESVNMSVAKTGKDDRACGLLNADLIHQAICRLVASGVTVVAAAGNNSFNAGNLIPASYDEVITVSALADSDGMRGGLGGNACFSWGTYDRDDTFADFSNYGSDVDLIAPGKCILSTTPGNSYGYLSGTSMAAPHVAGAVALYKASRPYATPADVKAALRAAGTQDWNTATDPDGAHEPLLNVAHILALGTWTLDATSPVNALAESGGTVQVPVNLTRAEDVSVDVALSVEAPAGFGTEFSAPSIVPGATSAVLTVVVPPSQPAGQYVLRILGTSGEVTVAASATVTVDGEPPVMPVPRLGPMAGTRFDTTSFQGTLSWEAATDATSSISRYLAQARIGSGAWGRLSTVGPGTLSVTRTVPVGQAYAVRVRAVDGADNYSAWSELSPLRARVIQDNNTGLSRTGSWHRYANRYMSGGATRYGTTAGTSAALTFTGTAVAVVMAYGPGRGKAQVWVDGAIAATVDTYRATLTGRRIVFARTWATKARHVVKVVILGTARRPRVDLDAFLVIE